MPRLTTDEKLMKQNELIRNWLKEKEISLQEVFDIYSNLTKTKIIIKNLTNGKYEIGGKSEYLLFEAGSTDSNTYIYIDKKSALEIAHTLIDSLDMLDKNAEELICEMQEKIENL